MCAAIGLTLRTILARASTQLSVSSDGAVSYNSGSGSSSSNGQGKVHVLNNLDWFGPMSFLDFLRDVGKYARVGQMLAKDSVRVACLRLLSSGRTPRIVAELGLHYATYFYGNYLVLQVASAQPAQPYTVFRRLIWPLCTAPELCSRLSWCSLEHVLTYGMLHVSCRSAPAWSLRVASASLSSLTSSCKATISCT
jgi:hypothetical protein